MYLLFEKLDTEEEIALISVSDALPKIVANNLWPHSGQVVDTIPKRAPKMNLGF